MVLGLVGGTDRADLDAGRILALVAELGDEKLLGDLLVRNLKHAGGVLIQFLAGEAVEGPFGRVHADFPVFFNNVALDPSAGDVGGKRDLVFDLAGLDAKAAADAFVGIDEERPPHGRIGGKHLPGVDQLESRQRNAGPGDEDKGVFHKITPFHDYISSRLGVCGLWHSLHSIPVLCSSGSMPGMSLRPLEGVYSWAWHLMQSARLRSMVSFSGSMG